MNGTERIYAVERNNVIELIYRYEKYFLIVMEVDLPILVVLLGNKTIVSLRDIVGISVD